MASARKDSRKNAPGAKVRGRAPSTQTLMAQAEGRELRAGLRLARKIAKEEVELKKRIAGDPQLAKDQQFFTKILGWDEGTFLKHLYWNCGIVRMNPPVIVAEAKRRFYPVDGSIIDVLCAEVEQLAGKLKSLSKTRFSPDRMPIFVNEHGKPLRTREQEYLRAVFHDLPWILTSYARHLRRKKDSADRLSRLEGRILKDSMQKVFADSLYEQIRMVDGRHHMDRLHRLVNAARVVRGLKSVEKRSFVVWLGRMKKSQGVGRVKPCLGKRPD